MTGASAERSPFVKPTCHCEGSANRGPRRSPAKRVRWGEEAERNEQAVAHARRRGMWSLRRRRLRQSVFPRVCSAPAGAGDFLRAQKVTKDALETPWFQVFPARSPARLSLPCPTRLRIVVARRSKVVCRLRSGPAAAPGQLCRPSCSSRGRTESSAPTQWTGRFTSPRRAVEDAAPYKGCGDVVFRRGGRLCPPRVCHPLPGRIQGSAPTQWTGRV
jgi:hypothetical protein